MRKLATIGMVTVMALGLSGCSNMNNQQSGTLVGAGLGGILGATLFHGDGQAAGVVAGAVLGGLIGNQIGANMDAQDQARMRAAIANNRINQSSTWQGGRHGDVTYSVKPVRHYRSHHRYCREYQTKITVGGKTRRAYGRACEMPDGQWKIVR